MLGYDSYKVPEAATLMINGGIDWAAISTEAQLLEAQRQLLHTQVSHCNDLVQLLCIDFTLTANCPH